MRHRHFTISGILAFVLFLAVGLAGLKGATEEWDGAILGLTLVALLASVLLAVHARGSRRAYWLGFALFGWAYLALCQVPAIEARLPTTGGLTYLDSMFDVGVGPPKIGPIPGGRPLPGLRVIRTANGDVSVGTSPNGTIQFFDTTTNRSMRFVSGARENFARIGHSLLALTLAWFGAIASRSLHDREAASSRQPLDQDTSTSSSTSESDPAGSVASILIP